MLKNGQINGRRLKNMKYEIAIPEGNYCDVPELCPCLEYNFENETSFCRLLGKDLLMSMGSNETLKDTGCPAATKSLVAMRWALEHGNEIDIPIAYAASF
jgi:hypothetical protein